MDWDKLRIFYKVAEAGSFTRAGDELGLSQSAVSRQVSALERDLKVPLFHRHARGLIRTEQGELLFRSASEIANKLEATRARLADSREVPSGDLRITTTVGLGSHWLTPRIGEFMDRYPDIRVQLILTNEELDLSMREADVALRLRQPVQADLIQRRLFTVHFHVYASADYVKRWGAPQALADLDEHRILSFGRGTRPAICSPCTGCRRPGVIRATLAPSIWSPTRSPRSRRRWITASVSRCCRTILPTVRPR